MRVMNYSFFTSGYRIYRLSYMAFSWILGISVGILTARVILKLHNPLMLVGNYAGVSIVPIILVKVLPLFVSIFLSLYFSDQLILILAFIRSFLFGFCSSVIYCIYDHTAWLIHILLLFTGFFVNVALLYYWISILLFHRRSLFAASIISGIILLVLIAEQCFLVPLLAMLNF